MMRYRRLAIILVASGAAIVGLHGLFGTWQFLIPSAVGMAGALAMIFVAHWRSLYSGEAIAASLLAFVVLGPVAVLDTPGGFLSSLINAWSNALSAAPPVELSPERRVIPYALAWFAVLVGGLLAVRRPGPMAMVGPLITLGLAAMLGAAQPSLVLAQGLVLGVGTLLLVAQSGEHSAIVTMATVGAIAVGAAGLTSVLLPSGLDDRFDLRTHLDRPWDPLLEPSPLVTLKAELKEGRNEAVVFSVVASEPLLRWSSAVLADYSGTVWTVADETLDAPAQFVPIERTVPQEQASGNEISYLVEIHDLDAPWLPISGLATTIDAGPGPASSSLESPDLRFNPSTGTIAAPAGLESGLVLSMTAIEVPELADGDLLDLETQAISAEDAEQTLDLVPPMIRNLSGDLFEGVDPGMARALSIKNTFQQEGFYDSSDSARPGHSLARLAEFLEDPTRIVGYAEQYAASAAVLARIGGLPTRVVVGYQIDAEAFTETSDGRLSADVLADDASAWIEVLTVEQGWVAVDVTPDRTREPQPEQLGVTINDVVIPNPPPDPPPIPDRQSTSQTDDSEVDDDDDELAADGGTLPRWQAATVAAAGITLAPIGLLAALGGLVLLLKRRRSKARRELEAEEAVAAAWQEIVDRFSEVGVPHLRSATPSESVRHFINSDPKAAEAADDLLALADLVDRSAFHHQRQDADTRNDAWEHCDQAVERLHANRSRRERIWIATDPRPLLTRQDRTSRRPATREPADS